MRTPAEIPSIQFNHEKLLRAFDEKPATLRDIMKQTGQDPLPSYETVRNWLRSDRRFITSHWLAAVIIALRKSNRIQWPDVFHKEQRDG